MRYQGRLTNWNDEKGYGFVTPNGGGDKAFVHIKAFMTTRSRPVDGDIITYEVTRDAKNRLQAKSIRHAGDPKPGLQRESSQISAIIVVAIFLCLLVVSIVLGKIPVHAIFFYLIVSGITFIIYANDKSAAINNRWRTPESTLHLFGMIGGWPGALIAQRMFRHKSKKREFQAIFWITIIINCAILAWLTTQTGASIISQFASKL